MHLKRRVENIQYSLFGFFVVLLLLVSPVSSAQDSINCESFQSRLLQNIREQAGSYPWNDAAFYPGKLLLADKTRQKETLKEVKNRVYYSEKFEDCYLALTSLNRNEKEVFIKSFQFYHSAIKEELAKAGLSEDFNYLPAVLSAFNTKANSTYKRAGTWQLSHFQGVLNGLRISKLMDERMDVQKATRAAIQEMKRNETLFDDSDKAVLAFVFGKTQIKNLCSRAGGADCSVENLLKVAPEEIKDFMAAYHATVAFLNQNKFIPEQELPLTAQVKVRFQTHFEQIVSVLPITLDELRFLNPQFVYSIIPEQAYLTVPENIKPDFLFLQDSIFKSVDSTLFTVVVQQIEYPPAPNRQFVGEKVKDLQIEGKTKISYTIKSGDVLGFIAEDYDVRVADLKYWNNIYNERKIQAGKTLDIFVDDENADYYRNLQTQKNSKEEPKTILPDFAAANLPGIIVPESSRKVEHIVKSGESPYVIAQKYDGVTPEKILEWNSIHDARKIQIGQKLIIYVQ